MLSKLHRDRWVRTSKVVTLFYIAVIALEFAVCLSLACSIHTKARPTPSMGPENIDFGARVGSEFERKELQRATSRVIQRVRPLAPQKSEE